MLWRLTRPVESGDWRRLASEEDLREYDAFGPWIYDVKAERDTPKRFRAACERHRGARFLLKVPCSLDRRDARPGMDLYLAMLAVHDDGISLMRLADQGVAERDVVWSEVAAVESYVNLLMGRWTLLLRDGSTFVVDYNAVSSRLLDDVTSFVRPRIIAPAERSRAVRPGPALEIADYFFRNQLFAKRRGSPGVAPIHLEPKDRLCRDKSNRLRLSNGVMILDAPDELIIVNRGKPARRFFEPNYAGDSIFVPYAGLTSFSLVAPRPGRAPRFHQLTLRLDRQAIRQPCLVAPEEVVMRLTERGVPQIVE